MWNVEFVIFLDKTHQMLYSERNKTVCSLSKGVFFMRKILALLLMLALLLPCALAETPQGIDLALTSTYGDGLSLRMTAGLSETPFCSLTLPSGQIDLAFSPDKGLCVQSGGQWAQLLVEGHPVDAALLTTPLKLLDGRSPSEALGLLAEDVNKMLAPFDSPDTFLQTLMKSPAFARIISDLYVTTQTGTVAWSSKTLNGFVTSLLDKLDDFATVADFNFSAEYWAILESLNNFAPVNDLHYRDADNTPIPNFVLYGQVDTESGSLVLNHQGTDFLSALRLELTYEQTAQSSWHYTLTIFYDSTSTVWEGSLYWRSIDDFALNGYCDDFEGRTFSITCSGGMLIAGIDDGYSLSIIPYDDTLSVQLDKGTSRIFSLDYTPDRIHAELSCPPLFYLLPADTGFFVLDITPASDGMDIVVRNLTMRGDSFFDLFTAHIRTALNGLICTGVYGGTAYRLALTETATGFSLLLSLPDGDFHLDFAALSDTSCSLTFTDAAGQQVSLTGSLCTPESPVIPDTLGTIELTQLLDDLF